MVWSTQRHQRLILFSDGLAFVFYAFSRMRSVVNNRGARVYLCTDGLMRVKSNAAEAMCWDQVREVSKIYMYYGLAQVGVGLRLLPALGDLPSQLGFKSEAEFAAGVKGTTCKVNSVKDSAGTGTIALVTSNGPGTFDETLVNQNGTWKIDSAQAQATPTPSAASTPTTTFQEYCDALKGGDYHTAYNLLSNAAQSQTSETQFAASFSTKVTDCTLSNVNDTAVHRSLTTP